MGTPQKIWHLLKARLWILLILYEIGGCKATQAVIEPPIAKSPPIIRFCGNEVPAEANTVREVVLRHVSPGLPVETARARLQELGFCCLYAGVFPERPALYHPTRSLPELITGRDAQKDKHFHSLVCSISGIEKGDWSQHYSPIVVTLPYDENGDITEMEVASPPLKTSRHGAFFSRRPKLREPIGVPIDQARCLMQAEKFHCAYVSPNGQGRDQRPYLDCYAYNEHLLGGDIVRVHLFYDETGRVTEAEVVEKPGVFDDLRCMLPNNSDTLIGGAIKTAVFPFRLYTAFVVAGLAADLSLARP